MNILDLSRCSGRYIDNFVILAKDTELICEACYECGKDICRESTGFPKRG